MSLLNVSASCTTPPAFTGGLVHASCVLERTVAGTVAAAPAPKRQCTPPRSANPLPLIMTTVPPPDGPPSGVVADTLTADALKKTKRNPLPVTRSIRRSPLRVISKGTLALRLSAGAMQRAEVLLSTEATAATSPNKHAAGSEAKPTPCTRTSVPPTSGPPRGARLERCTAPMSKSVIWSLVRTNVAPSAEKASGSTPPELTTGVTHVTLRPSLLTRACMEPYRPNRTRASPRSASPEPNSVSGVPPATGAPSGEIALTTSSAYACP